ncbi:MAG TPA: glycoside hydrolase family 2 TIM barrel-domain containing protein, partial [Bacteroidales bacterium]|nr:glycoside hydrolase family 2 TIM barrel-domain containing protein [Bacteroidales bacterium]
MEKYRRKAFILLIMMLAVQSFTHAQVSFGKPEKINEEWEFYLGDTPGEKAQWRKINLPHDWSIEGVLNPSLAACTGYLPGGIAWYRKNITIPEAKKGEKIYIYFEGIQNRSEVYINGQLLGKRPNGYVSFLYDMTPYIKYGKENLLTVRVDHSRYADSRWYSGSGIYRNVWLVYSGQIHMAQWGVFCYAKTVTDKRAELSVESEVENNTDKQVTITVNHQLTDASGKVVASASAKVKLPIGVKQKNNTALVVANPRLWNLKAPYLYTLKTTLTELGKVIDETSTRTGIRQLTFDADKGFALNGESMKMKGLCIHHDAGVLGAAVPREVWERRLKSLKSLGCNAIRMTHNLHNPDVYELCDELGLLVMNEVFDEWEFPKRKWIQGWNVGEPGFQGASDYFNEWCETDLSDGIRRDRNHPCIFAWSIGNEVDYPNDPYSHKVLEGSSISQPMFGGYQPTQPPAERLSEISKRLVSVVKKYDYSRPVTAGLAGVVMSNQTEYPFVLDIAGYNYTEDRYDIDHKTYPKRVIYGSENRHDMPAWKAVRDKEHIFGQFLWTGIDYLGESGVWPSRGFYSGLLDFAGYIKPRGYFRKALWTSDPTIYLGTYPNKGRQSQPSMDAWPVWNYDDGQEIRVVCYTNAKKVQLYNNNVAVGDPKDYDDNTGIIYWDIPYKPGDLTVKGYDENNQVTCEYSIKTSKQPATIALHAYAAGISRNRGVAQIEVKLLDDKGVPVVLGDNKLACHVEGPGKLLGLEAGDNTDMGNYRDHVQRAYMGRMIAYVEATGEGAIKISFSS